MNTLKIEADLANKYGYKPLTPELSDEYRALFVRNIPLWLMLTGDNDQKLYSPLGACFASGYNRIVIGDYGAFIEFAESQAIPRSLKIKRGQEYRVNDPKYAKNVKYVWLTTRDESDIKVYQQVRRVNYADYKPGMYYVSVHEVSNERDVSWIN